MSDQPKKSKGGMIFIILGIGAVLGCGCCVGVGGLGMVFVAKSRDNALAAQARLNLKQIGMAAIIHAETYRNLPPGKGVFAKKNGTVLYHLLPFVEQKKLWELGPQAAQTFVVSTYFSPSDSTTVNGMTNAGMGAASYAGNLNLFPVGDVGLQYPACCQPAGTANVVMFATVAANCSNGTHGHSDLTNPPLLSNAPPTFNGPPFLRETAAALSGGRVEVLMADQSTRSVTSKVSPGTWAIVLNPKANVPVPPDWHD